MTQNFTQHKNSYLFYLGAAVIAVVLSSMLKKQVVSIQADRILQVVVVLVSATAFIFYRIFKKQLMGLKDISSVEERFNKYSVSYKNFWFQLFVIIAIDSFGFFVTANSSFLILTFSVFIFLILFFPTRMGAQILLKIPKEHPVLK
jgi:hypothetical protein